MKSMKSEEQNGEVYAEMVGGRKLIEEVKASLNASSSTFTASATAVALKKEEQSLYSIDSRSFEESIVSASSDEFSIEEEEEEEEEEGEYFIYKGPVVNPQDFPGEGTSSSSKCVSAKDLSQPQNVLETNLSQQKCEECMKICE